MQISVANNKPIFIHFLKSLIHQAAICRAIDCC
jgi:hypothetical protein